ncbi:MAG TPA: hypothetical protein VI248_17475 [Kineosporiaceae bacterium]
MRLNDDISDGSRYRRRVVLLTAVAAAALVGLVAAVVPLASAEEAPTSLELLRQCDSGADFCVFHVQGPADDFWQKADLVGKTANCTGSPQDASITWTKSTFSSNSIGVSLKVLVGASKAFLNGFRITYSHEWTETTTDSDTTKITIPPGYMGRVYHAREMERASGEYELHFRSRYYGHYYWYVPMTVTSPKTDAHDHVTTQSVPLTDEERVAYCA